MSNEVCTSAIERVRFAVTVGASEDELALHVIKLAEADQPTVRAALAAVLTEQRNAEAWWTDAHSNDRLSAASLRWSTPTTRYLRPGWLSLRTSERQKANGELTHGAVFFHEQDIESGVAGHGLMLAFGAFDDGPEHGPLSHALAVDVCRTLRRHGVRCDWDGDLNRRLAVAPFTGSRRRFTEAPPYALIADDPDAEPEAWRRPPPKATTLAAKKPWWRFW
jgi:hypothetical protein